MTVGQIKEIISDLKDEDSIELANDDYMDSLKDFESPIIELSAPRQSPARNDKVIQLPQTKVIPLKMFKIRTLS